MIGNITTWAAVRDAGRSAAGYKMLGFERAGEYRTPGSSSRRTVGAAHPASRNVIAFTRLGIYRIVLPLFGMMVSAQAELIGGY